MALFMFNIIDLNNDVIDRKNIKPKPFKLEMKENLFTDNLGNKVTWQEVNVKDQILTISSVCSSTHTIVVTGTGPVTYKRGQWFFNPQKQESYQLNTDVSDATVGAVTISLVVNDELTAVATNNLRMSGYSKPYGLAEGNVFDADQVAQLYNLFTGANMALSLDQNEVNANYIFKADVKEYLKQKTQEASRKMLVNIWRSMYTGIRGTSTIGGATSVTAGGLDDFLVTVSGITAQNIGTGATGAKAGEIVVNGSTVTEKRQSFLSAVTQIHLSPLPNIKGTNKLVFLCTTPFMREIEELFYDRLLINDSLNKIDLEVKTISFSGGTVSFIVDEMLDDLNRYISGGNVDIYKKCYCVPIDYARTVVKANDVVSKTGQEVLALGMGKYFIPPQTAEESFNLRLYTSYSAIWGAIKSGAYRKITLNY
jgi:hypothetical protein